MLVVYIAILPGGKLIVGELPGTVLHVPFVSLDAKRSRERAVLARRIGAEDEG